MGTQRRTSSTSGPPKGGVQPEIIYHAPGEAASDKPSAKVVQLGERRRKSRRENPREMTALRKRIVEWTVDRMNRTHAVIEYGNDVLIVSAYWDAKGDFKPRFRKRSALVELMESRRVCLPKVGAKGRVTLEYINPVALWMQHPRRRTLDEMVNAPGETLGPKKLNMWQGWGTCPRMIPLTDWDGNAVAGDDGKPTMIPDYSGDACPRILSHIREVWCANAEPGFFDWVIAWLADIVQHPTRKKGTGLMIYGGQGAGKSIVIEEVMSRILGSAYTMERDTRFLTKDFNAKVGGKLLIFADEAIFAGDPGAAARLKTFLTAPRLDIRALYKDSVDVDNHARVFAAANGGPVHGHVLPLEKDDRRWSVAEASEHLIGNTQYFAAFMEEVENGGAEAFHAYLLNPRLLDRVNLRLPYQTASTVTQKLASLGDAEAFLYECLRTGTLQTGLPGSSFGEKKDWEEPCNVAKDDLHRGYLAWFKATHRPRSPLLASPFGVALRSMFPDLQEGRSGSAPRFWRLPSLEAARASFQGWLNVGDEPGALARLWNDEAPAEPAEGDDEPRVPCTAEQVSANADFEIPF